ncbi:MAG: hypothetical protein COT06_05650 [Syntrophobacteraceae bacterium CG07_land_8_20_14_0_80_61_8]|nr:MAG: hypothetical protein COT06_05650 [Syntrophobacteraceae bacterium CG07_land_8_20_14_0_80_61_8]
MSGKGMRWFGLALPALAVLLPLLVSEVSARDFKGVSFADESLIQGRTCRLNGVGVRKKFLFDIYYAGLYLPEPTQDPGKVPALDGPKRVLMHVVYKEVTADKWVEGWKEGFAVTAPRPNADLAARIEKFLACFDQPVKSGERVQITYVPNQGTEVMIKDKVKATIPGRDFMTALWSIWFGNKPASETLMNGMLGR